MNCEKAFKRFLKIGKGYPQFKKRGTNDSSVYLPKNGKGIAAERHKIKILALGWVRLKEKAYIPQDADISSVTVTRCYIRWQSL